MKTKEQKEIERLRAAIVHAMDDCENAVTLYHLGGGARALIIRAASQLKAALEKP